VRSTHIEFKAPNGLEMNLQPASKSEALRFASHLE